MVGFVDRLTTYHDIFQSERVDEASALEKVDGGGLEARSRLLGKMVDTSGKRLLSWQSDREGESVM